MSEIAVAISTSTQGKKATNYWSLFKMRFLMIIVTGLDRTIDCEITRKENDNDDVSFEVHSNCANYLITSYHLY